MLLYLTAIATLCIFQKKKLERLGILLGTAESCLRCKPKTCIVVSLKWFVQKYFVDFQRII